MLEGNPDNALDVARLDIGIGHVFRQDGHDHALIVNAHISHAHQAHIVGQIALPQGGFKNTEKIIGSGIAAGRGVL